MTPEVIKEFLVSLGFGVDREDLKKFNEAIASASARVTSLYTAIQVAAAGIFYGVSKISQSFEDMGYEMRLIAPSINRVLMLRQDLLKAYAATGTNIMTAIQNAVKFNISLEKTKNILKATYDSIGAKFFPLLTKQMDIFRAKIYANMPKIQDALVKFVSFIFKAFDATVQLGMRVYSILERVWEFFVKLHKATDGWSTVILGVIAAWKLLNLSFLATPLGMLIAGLGTLLLLFDDYKTFMEGGDSLFDWSKAVPVIKAVTKALDDMWGIVDKSLSALKDLSTAMIALSVADFSKAADSFGAFIDKIKSIVSSDIFPKLIKLIHMATNPLAYGADVIRDMIADNGGIGGVFDSLKNSSGVKQLTQPFYANPAGVTNSGGNSNSVTVNSQTAINVNGVADANAAGKAVAGQQDKVNMGITRNLTNPLKPTARTGPN